jgi:hypothetical protein
MRSGMETTVMFLLITVHLSDTNPTFKGYLPCLVACIDEHAKVLPRFGK